VDRARLQVLDELLAASAKAGSAKAFAQLVERTTPGLRRHAQRLVHDRDLADDVVQDAWVSIARGLSRLTDTSRFRAWTYAITTRKAVDAIRRLVRERRAKEAVAALPVMTTVIPDADGDIDLKEAISRLPLDQRLLVSLHYGEGLSIEEIASAHDIPAGTVKSRLFAARAVLKTHLEGGHHDPR
jgi:RNA polymerase sigma factor (sigma-70 family)